LKKPGAATFHGIVARHRGERGGGRRGESERGEGRREVDCFKLI
jgi:hypothetical protein